MPPRLYLILLVAKVILLFLSFIGYVTNCWSSKKCTAGWIAFEIILLAFGAWYLVWSAYVTIKACAEISVDEPTIRIRFWYRVMEIIIIGITAYSLARSHLSLKYIPPPDPLANPAAFQDAMISKWSLGASWAVFGADSLEFLWSGFWLWWDWRKAREMDGDEGEDIELVEREEDEEDVEQGEAEDEVVGGGQD